MASENFKLESPSTRGINIDTFLSRQHDSITAKDSRRILLSPLILPPVPIDREEDWIVSKSNHNAAPNPGRIVRVRNRERKSRVRGGSSNLGSGPTPFALFITETAPFDVRS